jgi:signal transduction histidine kinase
VETHGGKIWVESEGIGKGIEVHILLPHKKIMNNETSDIMVDAVRVCQI